MESPLDLKTYRSGVSFNYLAKLVNFERSALNVADADHVLIKENFSRFDFYILLKASEKSIRSFLQSISQLFRQVNIYLLAHMLSKNFGKMWKYVFKLAFFLSKHFELVNQILQWTLYCYQIF